MVRINTRNRVDSPDYRCPAYEQMHEYRTICQDVKEGTVRIREKKQDYLPRFEGEDNQDWLARVKMTFVDDYYEQTLNDHVGLITAKPPRFLDDGDKVFELFKENVDGKGTHAEVFAERVCRASIDDGLSFIFTDYPHIPAGQRVTIRQARELGVRPYWNMVYAEDVPNWKFEKIGGVSTLVQVTVRECEDRDDGPYGTTDNYKYRVITQQVIYATQPGGEPVAVALGDITWILYEEREDKKGEYIPSFTGQLIGQERIPLQVIYGGRMVDDFVAYPFLYQLALTTIEETQTKSDYATVMHKCNVPTPILIGRPSVAHGKPIAMGKAIDIPQGGDAKMLEPTGVALDATRQRLQDIQSQLRRQGAVVKGETAQQAMTATEASLYVRQRNARLRTSARSLQDGLENAGADAAVYYGLAREAAPSIQVLQDFSGAVLDPIYLTLIFNAWQAGLLPPDAALHALKTGELPDDFNVEAAALKSMSQLQVVRDALSAGKNPLQPATPPAGMGNAA